MDVPLTDTAEFDVECEYRLKYTAPTSGNVTVDDWVYNPSRVGKKIVMWYGPTVMSNAKNILWWSNDQNGSFLNATVTW